MQVCFDLLIPEVVFEEDFPFQEEKALWGDESFSQDPKRFSWKGLVTFTKRQLPEHISNYLPDGLDVTRWEYLSLDSSAIAEWEKNINGKDMSAPLLLKELLVQLLSKLDGWVVIFELNCDQIDNVYRMRQHELIKKVEYVLNWSNKPEGFIAWDNS